jgi:hypothetical protein
MSPTTASFRDALSDSVQPAETGPHRAPRARFDATLARVITLAKGSAPALAPAAVYLAVRGVGLLVLTLMAASRGAHLGNELRSWDGEWLLALAGGSYFDLPQGLVDAFGQRDPSTAFAFFPGYPALVGAVRLLTGADLLASGMIVTLVAGVFAAYALTRLGELVPGGSRRAGLALVALFAAAPMAVALSMTYSEALFCALAAWSLVWVLQRHWVAAGLACAGAGLVRPTAIALVLAVLVAAAVAIVTRPSARSGDGWRPWVGAALAPTGLVGYLAFVAVQPGVVGGWFGVQQRGWNSRFDGGAATLSFTTDVLATGRSVLELVTVVVLAGAFVLLAISIVRRLPLPLVIYGAAVLVLVVGSNGLMNSKARLLLPAFTLLLPVALALARRRPSTMIAVLGAATLGSAWFGAYALLGWPYAI